MLGAVMDIYYICKISNPLIANMTGKDREKVIQPLKISISRALRVLIHMDLQQYRCTIKLASRRFQIEL